MKNNTSLSRRSLTVPEVTNAAVIDRVLNGPLILVFAAIPTSGFPFLPLCPLWPIRREDFRTVHPGVEYAQVDHKIANGPVKINLLRLDLTKVRLDVHHALDKAIGVEPTSSIATRRGAIAAINAGFFRLDKSGFLGDPAGVLLIDGELWSEAERERVALRLINKKKTTDVFIGHLDTQAWFAFGELHSQIKLSGVNRERKEDEFIVYGGAFGPTTLVSTSGTDLVLSSARGLLRRSSFRSNAGILPSSRTSRTLRYRETATSSRSDPKSKRKRSCFLTIFGSISQVATKAPDFPFSRGGQTSGARYQPDEEEDIVAGVPQLIKDGKIHITWEQEKAGRSFVELRHPRTAVAKLKDGKFLMITVDGRQPGVSVGMTSTSFRTTFCHSERRTR